MDGESSREQTTHVVGSCLGFLESYNGSDLSAPVCRPAARERSRTARKTKLTSDYFSLHPHARAAGAPTGRSFFWCTVHRSVRDGESEAVWFRPGIKHSLRAA